MTQTNNHYHVTFTGILFQPVRREFPSWELAEQYCRKIGRPDLIDKIEPIGMVEQGLEFAGVDQ